MTGKLGVINKIFSGLLIAVLVISTLPVNAYADDIIIESEENIADVEEIIEDEENTVDVEEIIEDEKPIMDIASDEETIEEVSDSVAVSNEFEYSEYVDGYDVSLYADEGVFPNGTTVDISRASDLRESEIGNRIEQGLDISLAVKKSVVFDFTFMDANGNEIEPENGSVKVSVRVNSEFMDAVCEDELSQVKVFHIDDSESLDEIDNIRTNDCSQEGSSLMSDDEYNIVFDASEFSEYALIVIIHKEDVNAPTIESIELKNPQITIGESCEVIINAADDLSGVNACTANFVSLIEGRVLIGSLKMTPFNDRGGFHGFFGGEGSSFSWINGGSTTIQKGVYSFALISITDCVGNNLYLSGDEGPSRIPEQYLNMKITVDDEEITGSSSGGTQNLDAEADDEDIFGDDEHNVAAGAGAFPFEVPRILEDTVEIFDEDAQVGVKMRFPAGVPTSMNSDGVSMFFTDKNHQNRYLIATLANKNYQGDSCIIQGTVRIPEYGPSGDYYLTSVQWKTNDGTSYDYDENDFPDDSYKLCIHVQLGSGYRIAFDGNGATSGTMEMLYDCQKNKNVKLTANAFVRDGYTFNGWNTKPDGTGKNYSNKSSVRNLGSAGETVRLYAKWKINQYTIRYNYNGGTSVKNPTKYNVETDDIELLESTRKGYSFAGWFDQKEGGNKITVIPKGSFGNLVLYARWTIVTYNIVYDLRDSDTDPAYNDPANPNTYDVTQIVRLKNPQRTGFTFAGWEEYAANGKFRRIGSIAKGSVGDRTLYAKWTENTYTINYNGNGSTGGRMTAQTVKYTEAATLKTNAFVKKGADFLGWKLDKTSTANVFEDENPICRYSDVNRKKITLYANWQLIPYTIEYFNCEEVSENDNPIQYNVETKSIVLKNPVRDGYVFKGWYSDATMKKRVTRINRGSVGNVELYAKWQAK